MISETEKIRREQRRREIEMDKEFGGGHTRPDRCKWCGGYGFMSIGADCPYCDGSGREGGW